MKTLKTALLSTFAALCSGGVFAATTWSGSVSLTSDLNETDELIVESGATVDLNGHSVTLDGKLTVNGAATVTNSDEGDCKDVSLRCTNDLTDQFQNKLTFSGNLKLTVSGNCSNAGGFQGANNTHTGGTVLDGYNTSGVGRFNNGTAFGTGTLTLTNSSRLYMPSAQGAVTATSPYWSSIFSSGNNVTNVIKWDQQFTFPSDSKITVAKNNTLKLEEERRGQVPIYDISESEGTLILQFTGGDGNPRYELRGAKGMPNGTLEFAGGVKEHRWNGTYADIVDATLEFGALRTSSDITSTGNAPSWVNTTDQGRIALKVGGLGTDETFYGRLVSHNTLKKDWSVEKIGAGIWTLGGNNGYHGGTTLTEGTVKLIDVGELGDGNVTFNGGSLIVDEGATGTLYPNKFVVAEGKTMNATIKSGATPVLSSFTYTVSESAKLTDGIKLSSGTIAVESGAHITLTRLNIEADQTLDLDGVSISAERVSRSTSDGNRGILTNTSETLAVVTVGLNNGDFDICSRVRVEGNIKIVYTGTSGTYLNGSSTSPFTHTGGTTLSNQTTTTRFFAQSFGSGTVTLQGAKLFWPSANGNGTFENDFVVSEGTNEITVDINPGTLRFNGAWTGDGYLTWKTGHRPAITFAGDTSAFAGTFDFLYEPTDNRSVYFIESSVHKGGLPLGTILQTSRNGSQRNHIDIEPTTNSVFAIGTLGTTTTNEVDSIASVFADTYIKNNKSPNLTLRVGGRNEDSDYAGLLKDGNGKILLDKVGSGTLTLLNSLDYTGATTVSEGTLAINGSLANSAVTVKSGATLGGTGTITSAVTIEEGGCLTGSLTLASVPSGSGQILVSATDTEFMTFSGAIDASALTVKLTGELDTDSEYTILTAGSGSYGKATLVVDAPPAKGVWRTKWVTSGDTKILKGYYVKPGLVIIFK